MKFITNYKMLIHIKTARWQVLNKSYSNVYSRTLFVGLSNHKNINKFKKKDKRQM